METGFNKAQANFVNQKSHFKRDSNFQVLYCCYNPAGLVINKAGLNTHPSTSIGQTQVWKNKIYSLL